MPTVDGEGFVMLDVGANVDAKPIHLYQYAVMGSAYAEKVRGIKILASDFKCWDRGWQRKRAFKTSLCNA